MGSRALRVLLSASSAASTDKAASKGCRIPMLSPTDVLECAARTLQGHTYYVYAGTYPRADFRLELDADWQSNSASPSVEVGSGLCTECSSVPGVSWHVQPSLERVFELNGNYIDFDPLVFTSVLVETLGYIDDSDSDCSTRVIDIKGDDFVA